MHISDILQVVDQLKSTALPGWDAQSKMSPPQRSTMKDFTEAMRHSAKKAAVILLCYPDLTGSAHLVLIVRNTYNGVHSAQIGLPGGRPESQDVDLTSTALREMEEEIGFKPSEVRVIRPLSPLYIPPSNFYVQPFLGFTEKVPNFQKDDREVAQILECPLDDLIQFQKILAAVSLPKSDFKEVPMYLWRGHQIWGATAMILSELKDLLKQVV